MSWFRSRRGFALLAGIVLLILFIVRPGVGGLRKRIASSISFGLGRRVEIASASLRFLPEPGFDLENFVVYDDPAISLEPMVRADEVTASLRLAALLRGRLEISRLNLSDPSLNLVRANSGHWNLEYLVERASQTATAPTGKASNEKRLSFPYIEASGARINFKFGMEKKQFALTEADLALFQDSENSWGLRLTAKPVRTDSNFSDTGLLRISGSWQRAAVLRETPLRFSMQWEKAQLGQATKLIFGNDKGWRGAASLSAELTGTPENLAIITQGTVDDFRRYDIVTSNAIRLRTQCGANYSSDTKMLSNIICESPVGGGAVSMHGSLAVMPTPSFHFSVFAQDVPLQSMIGLARRAKNGVPADVLAAGTFNGMVKGQRENGGSIVWEGSAETSEFRLASQLAGSQTSIPKIHLIIFSEGEKGSANESHVKKRRTDGTAFSAQTGGQGIGIEVSPFEVAMGGSAPVTVAGWLSRNAYGVTVGGDAQLRRVLRAARVLGIPSPQFDAEGKVKLQLQIAGNWTGFKSPRLTGTVQLMGTRAAVAGLNEPIEIGAASVLLSEDKVEVRELTASMGGTTWHGSLILPRPCGTLATCPIEMNLHTGDLATDEFSGVFNPANAKAPWYRFLIASQRASAALALRANGTISADRILLHKLAGTNFSTDFELDRGKLHLTKMQAHLFGGTHVGDWTLDFTARPVSYSGEGSFQHIVLSQLAGTAHDNWISGTASATYHAAATGLNAAQIFSSATGLLHVEARNGSIPHIALTNLTGPLQLRRFEGNLILQHSQIEFDAARLETNNASYRVTGTASLKRTLNVTLLRGGGAGFDITGAVEAPIVFAHPIPTTQAVLKP